MTAHLLGADALPFNQPYQRRGSEAQDGRPGSADFTAISGPTLCFANSPLEASESVCVSPGALPNGFTDGRNDCMFALKRATFAFGLKRSVCHVDLMILLSAFRYFVGWMLPSIQMRR